MPRTVLVTGASGKTGALVVAELLKQPGKFTVRAVVRSTAAQQLLLEMGVSPANVFVIDLAGDAGAAALKAALQGCSGLVICTSAVPVPHILPTLWGGLCHWLRCKLSGTAAREPFVPVATWKGGQTPYQVDWQGQAQQVGAAKAAGVGHVVLVSSAGGTQPLHFLNHIGPGEVPARAGNILNWKRSAEQLLVESGVPFTILHPNHLNDDSAGRHQLVLAVDDELQRPHWSARMKMPRELLAQLAVHCLLLADEGAANRSFDCAGRKLASSEPDAAMTPDEVRQLLGSVGTCDYSINDRTKPGAVFVMARGQQHQHQQQPAPQHD